MKQNRDYENFDLIEMELDKNCLHDYQGYNSFTYAESDYAEPSPCRWMFQRCQVDHPSISLNQEVLGGIPHIYNTRLSVGQILGRLYVLGSIGDVAKYYSPTLTEDQVKEAIAYAQDFLELASDPSQAND